MRDRLGSSRTGGSKYFPYGEEQQVTAQDKDKFATYYRDGTTGLDYAQNRYYANTLGRFTSPDPYMSSGGTADPQSWNRYSYVQGDSD
jgi:RHS repeat-associated protein